MDLVGAPTEPPLPLNFYFIMRVFRNYSSPPPQTYFLSSVFTSSIKIQFLIFIHEPKKYFFISIHCNYYRQDIHSLFALLSLSPLDSLFRLQIEIVMFKRNVCIFSRSYTLKVFPCHTASHLLVTVLVP